MKKRGFWTVLAVLTLLLAGLSLMPQPARADTTALNPTQDTWLDKENSTNYGDSAVISVKAEDAQLCRALLEFDLSSIPAGSTITSATLTLELVGSDQEETHDVSVHAMLNTAPAQNWTENGATWTTYDGTNSWSSEGADGDFNTTAVDTQTVDGGVNGPYSWNVTSLVQDWYNGVLPNNGLLLKGAPEERGRKPHFDFSSRQGTTPPELMITYASSTAVTLTSFAARPSQGALHLWPWVGLAGLLVLVTGGLIKSR